MRDNLIGFRSSPGITDPPFFSSRTFIDADVSHAPFLTVHNGFGSLFSLTLRLCSNSLITYDAIGANADYFRTGVGADNYDLTRKYYEPAD